MNNNNVDYDLVKVLNYLNDKFKNENNIVNANDNDTNYDLKLVLECIDAEITKPITQIPLISSTTKYPKKNISQSLFQYFSGDGFKIWYSDLKKRKERYKIVNYIRYKLRKFIENYSYLIENKKRIFSGDDDLMNSLDTNKKEVIDMYYDHRILQNLFNFDVVTEKTNQHVKTLDSLKRIYSLFDSNNYDEKKDVFKYTQFIFTENDEDSKINDLNFFIYFNFWIYLNYYITRNALLFREIHDYISSLILKYFKIVNNADFGKDNLYDIFLISKSQYDIILDNKNYKGNPFFHNETIKDFKNKYNDEIILKREDFTQKIFSKIKFDCYLFPPEFFLKTWNNSELYIYIKENYTDSDTDILFMKYELHDFENNTNNDDYLVYLILEDKDDDILPKQKEVNNNQIIDKIYSVIARLFSFNALNKAKDDYKQYLIQLSKKNTNPIKGGEETTISQVDWENAFDDEDDDNYLISRKTLDDKITNLLETQKKEVEQNIIENVKKMIQQDKRRRFALGYYYNSKNEKKCPTSEYLKKTITKFKNRPNYQEDSCFPIRSIGKITNSIKSNPSISNVTNSIKSNPSISNVTNSTKTNSVDNTSLEIEKIKDDGNCFFTALSKAFPDYDVAKLREHVADNFDIEKIKSSFNIIPNNFDFL